MSFLADIFVISGVIVAYAIALYLISNDFQIRRMGWPGYPAQLVLFLVNKSYRFGIWFRRKTRLEIVVEDLPIGEYVFASSVESQTLIGWQVYDYRSWVEDGKRNWIVLSRRPLPKHFEIVACARHNIMREIKNTTITRKNAIPSLN